MIARLKARSARDALAVGLVRGLVRVGVALVIWVLLGAPAPVDAYPVELLPKRVAE